MGPWSTLYPTQVSQWSLRSRRPIQNACKRSLLAWLWRETSPATPNCSRLNIRITSKSWVNEGLRRMIYRLLRVNWKWHPTAYGTPILGDRVSESNELNRSAWLTTGSACLERMPLFFVTFTSLPLRLVILFPFIVKICMSCKLNGNYGNIYYHNKLILICTHIHTIMSLKVVLSKFYPSLC